MWPLVKNMTVHFVIFGPEIAQWIQSKHTSYEQYDHMEYETNVETIAYIWGGGGRLSSTMHFSFCGTVVLFSLICLLGFSSCCHLCLYAPKTSFTIPPLPQKKRKARSWGFFSSFSSSFTKHHVKMTLISRIMLKAVIFFSLSRGHKGVFFQSRRSGDKWGERAGTNMIQRRVW